MIHFTAKHGNGELVITATSLIMAGCKSIGNRGVRNNWESLISCSYWNKLLFNAVKLLAESSLFAMDYRRTCPSWKRSDICGYLCTRRFIFFDQQ